VVDCGVELEEVGPADEVVEAADAEPGHDSRASSATRKK